MNGKGETDEATEKELEEKIEVEEVRDVEVDVDGDVEKKETQKGKRKEKVDDERWSTVIKIHLRMFFYLQDSAETLLRKNMCTRHQYSCIWQILRILCRYIDESFQLHIHQYLSKE